MDIRGFGRVLWRDRWVALVGLVLSVLIAILVAYTPGSHGLKTRATPTYESDVTLIVGAADTSLYAAVDNPPTPVAGVPDTSATAPKAADLGALTDLYAEVVPGQTIQNLVTAQFGKLARVHGVIQSFRVISSMPGQAVVSSRDRVLPVLDIRAVTDSALSSERLAQTTANVFTQYVVDQERAQGVSAADGVKLTTAQSAKLGHRTSKSPKTLVALIIVAGLIITLLVIAGRSGGRRREAEENQQGQYLPYAGGTIGGGHSELVTTAPPYAAPTGSTPSPARPAPRPTATTATADVDAVEPASGEPDAADPPAAETPTTAGSRSPEYRLRSRGSARHAASGKGGQGPDDEPDARPTGPVSSRP